MTWQPIETAPRDWTARLLLTVCHNVFAGYWCDEADGWVVPCPRGKGEMPFGRHDYPTHWQPLPPPPSPQCDTAAFLARMTAAAETGERVTADDVARLRRLANWADAPPAPGWNGTLDRGEAMRAIDAAERRMANG